jgi:hypothetical protein
MKVTPEYLKQKAAMLEQSFQQIKTDPMNLNLLMEHVANLSQAVTDLLHEMAEKDNED